MSNAYHSLISKINPVFIFFVFAIIIINFDNIFCFSDFGYSESFYDTVTQYCIYITFHVDLPRCYLTLILTICRCLHSEVKSTILHLSFNYKSMLYSHFKAVFTNSTSNKYCFTFIIIASHLFLMINELYKSEIYKLKIFVMFS